MTNIKTIIFDLGGVILNIDYRLTIEAFTNLGIENFREIYTQARQDTLFDHFEEGKITAEEFRDEIRDRANLDLSQEQVDRAWNSMILDMPEIRLEILEQLKVRKKLLLLSNTNEIHLDFLSRLVEAEHGMHRFNSVFEETFYSHQIGMRKPHGQVFEFVLHKHGLDPTETLFIDDSSQHIRGAQSVGINTIYIDGDTSIESLEEELLTL